MLLKIQHSKEEIIDMVKQQIKAKSGIDIDNGSVTIIGKGTRGVSTELEEFTVAKLEILINTD